MLPGVQEVPISISGAGKVKDNTTRGLLGFTKMIYHLKSNLADIITRIQCYSTDTENPKIQNVPSDVTQDVCVIVIFVII